MHQYTAAEQISSRYDNSAPMIHFADLVLSLLPPQQINPAKRPHHPQQKRHQKLAKTPRPTSDIDNSTRIMAIHPRPRHGRVPFASDGRAETGRGGGRDADEEEREEDGGESRGRKEDEGGAVLS